MGLFGKSKIKKKILFACIENSARSQMAEAFFKKYASDDYEAVSGGTDPKSYVSPTAIQVMKEVGIDMSDQKAKGISEDMIRESIKAVNMGCMDDQICPTSMIPKMIDWNIEDPKDQPIEKVREIRNEIEKRVKEFISQLQ